MVRKPPPPKLLTVQQVAERCGVSVRCVRHWIFEKRIPYVKLGRYVRVSELDLENFIESGRVEARRELRVVRSLKETPRWDQFAGWVTAPTKHDIETL